MLPVPAGVVRRNTAGVAIVLGVALAAAGLSGCSSSGGSKATSSAPPSTQAASSQPAATSAAPVTSSSAPPPVLSAADVKAIKNAYVSFFNSKTPAAKSVALLQHGTIFKATLQAQAKSPQAQGLSVTVSKVVSQQPSVAVATFTLLSAGKAVLPDTPGYAVKEGGKWKVSAGTFCQLLKLQNAAPKSCDDSKITAFPTS